MNHQYAMKRRQKHADGDDIIIIAWLLLLLLDDENIKFTLGSPLLHNFVASLMLLLLWCVILFNVGFSLLILFYFSSYVCRAFFHEVHRHQYSSAAAVVVVVGFDLEASWPAFCVLLMMKAKNFDPFRVGWWMSESERRAEGGSLAQLLLYAYACSMHVQCRVE